MTALPLDGLAALVALATVGSFTPGPNTMLALATGVRFGWRRVGPHALGVAVGLAAMLTFAATTAAANYAWAAVGSSLQAWLAVGRRRAWFDRGMGVALAASALAMLR
jgi:threonine/homoserine/homoserine lactone efflux protein